MTSNDLDMLKVKIPICMLHTPPRPMFCPFGSTMSRFRVTAQFWKKCIKWPQTDLDIFKAKGTHNAFYIHPRGTNFRPFRSMMICVCVMLPFSEKCTEWSKTNLARSRSKIWISMLHIPPRPKFSSVSLYCMLFLNYPLFSEKYTEWPQNDLDMFKVKGTHIHTTYIPEAQMFILFALRWIVCNEIEIFEIPIDYNAQIKP